MIKFSPVTPRKSTKNGSDFSSVPKYKKVDNFISTLLNDQMVTENWVSIQNESAN